MYPPLTTSSGAQRVNAGLDGFVTGTLASTAVDPALMEPDGLTLTHPQLAKDFHLHMPTRLREFLLDLRLLRGLPLAYLVPDGALLPPESIRFFEVDPTWIDRVVDGVLTAATIGTGELVYTAAVGSFVRAALDRDLMDIAQADNVESTWDPRTDPMTGMLMRSQATRRWPELKVNAGSVPILRAQPLSKDIYIALFAGRPTSVELREPPAGTRFGVEPTLKKEPWPFTVDARQPDGMPAVPPDRVHVTLRNAAKRTLDVTALATSIGAGPGGSGHVALHFEQRSFFQQFLHAVPEHKGSDDLPASDTLDLNGGRKGDVSHLRSRLLALAATGTS